MADISEGDRDAVLALVTKALRDAGRTAPPAEAEQGDWLRGDAEWSEPDELGWVALVLSRIDVWVPKAIVAWQVALRSGGLSARVGGRPAPFAGALANDRGGGASSVCHSGGLRIW